MNSPKRETVQSNCTNTGQATPPPSPCLSISYRGSVDEFIWQVNRTMKPAGTSRSFSISAFPFGVRLKFSLKEMGWDVCLNNSRELLPHRESVFSPMSPFSPFLLPLLWKLGPAETAKRQKMHIRWESWSGKLTSRDWEEELFGPCSLSQCLAKWGCDLLLSSPPQPWNYLPG